MANKLNVNPTRQELLKLKTKLKTAQRGHKLLKEKRDGLMKAFMEIIREAKKSREKIEGTLARGFKAIIFASADMRPEVLAEALAVPTKKTTLEATTKNVMSVHIPQFTYTEEGEVLCYSLGLTSSELDVALDIFSKVLKDLVTLAEIEHSARLLAAEIEKTRRRVNALEYVFIPNMRETIKYITDKLNEQDRGTILMLMKVKARIAEA
ncbi:MAG: V-type ATP synthase subunit D [Parcubacteria group bacterium CG08_land_8_20_14_0_20_48_21]|nr:MAG: V-type ATP synthase subunit D [Parcubacteria group bacterium CG2_30_48_51]PIS32489.1 MAG: V-type ATP synthase subunit D [Parcubacteria group bacterium CG08_land_8_20_14_0_20_48_21]PIY78010.1 MAG: V-type ATP synthase subunit D [Parcubacteria group bacterium CG_4_10_14_0_8_um_filter_48_154]PIZ77127.1 MAG: V-type ATP synthase subunit D [bacterium CG_4_10_14_0_2_um_filter_48_144]PJC39788.1 MAG: V-type ATP synthase subunit D [Parcubacteria group bacterium CG_4_9_14_0_2_um_filter_48_40]PJE52